MREWMPVSTSPKGRLALAAIKAFGARSFDEVTVGELAKLAGVTTGALYHHFGSKLGLYGFVRKDLEQRLLDRMRGAAAAATDGGDHAATTRAALVVGFDFAVGEGYLHILGTPPPGDDRDGVAYMLAATITPASDVLGRILAAAWRAALGAVAEGLDPQEARAALLALELRPLS